MFHPQYVCISSFPDDLIRQLIVARLHDLNDRNAQLSLHFDAIQEQLRQHEAQYRRHPQFCSTSTHEQSQANLDAILTQIENKHYNITHIQHGNNGNSNNGRRLRTDRHVSQQQKTPYHYSKFRKSMNKFSLSCSKQNNRLRWNRIKDDLPAPPTETHLLGKIKRNSNGSSNK